MGHRERKGEGHLSRPTPMRRFVALKMDCARLDMGGLSWNVLYDGWDL
jgi:hypothetical protein